MGTLSNAGLTESWVSKDKQAHLNNSKNRDEKTLSLPYKELGKRDLCVL